MGKQLLLSIGLLVWSSYSFSLEVCNPDLDELPKPEYFQDIYADAVLLGSHINNVRGSIVISSQLDEEYKRFSQKVKSRALSDMSHLPLDKLSSQLDFFVNVTSQGVDKNNLVRFSNNPHPLIPGKFTYYFTNNADNNAGEYDSSDPECASKEDLPSCTEGLNALAEAIAPYKAAFVKCSSERTSQGAARLTASWQRYLDESRSLTTLELLWTTWLESDHLAQDHLVGPMSRQWILLHPNLVIENVSDAPDGSKMELGITIEWLGINWWDKETSPFGFPFGVSITSLYSDRPGVDAVGNGLMVHFNNRYSVGWASHGGDDGFYISVDLLNMFVDKKSEWKKYESKINTYNPTK